MTGLCASTRPGTIVVPRASTITKPVAGPGASSASVGRIQAIRPSATRTLIPVSRRADRPVARLAPRYRVRRPLGPWTEALGAGAAVPSAGKPTPEGPGGEASGSGPLTETLGLVDAAFPPQAARNAATEAAAVSRRKPRRSTPSWRSRSSITAGYISQQNQPGSAPSSQAKPPRLRRADTLGTVRAMPRRPSIQVGLCAFALALVAAACAPVGPVATSAGGTSPAARPVTPGTHAPPSPAASGAIAPTSSIAPGAIGRTSIDLAASYDVALSLHYGDRRLAATSTMTVTNRSGGPIDRIELEAIAARLGHLALGPVTVDGRRVTPTVADQTIT